MIVDIDRLPEEGLKISKDFEIQDGDLVEENAVFLSPLMLNFLLKKKGERFVLREKSEPFSVVFAVAVLLLSNSL